MARVLLVDPPWAALSGLSSRAPQVGLMSLAASLQQAGHTVAIYHGDLYGRRFAPQGWLARHARARGAGDRDHMERCRRRLEELLKRWRPDVVGVHTVTPAWTSARRVAQLAKQVLPSVLTVCGGPHISATTSDLDAASGFDFAVLGEGEDALVRLVAAGNAAAREAIPGVVSAAAPAEGAARRPALVEELDSLPFGGDRALLDVHRFDRTALASLVTARGCPFGCAYCAGRVVWTRRVRYRSPEHVVAEVDEWVARHRVRMASFCDDTFTLHRDRAFRILALLRRRHPNLRWSCTTRADCLDRELVTEMRRSGCVRVAVGLESGSARLLSAMGKGESLAQIAAGCGLVRDAGLQLYLFVMVGFPGESEVEAWETLRVARALAPVRLIGNVLVPYPGSELYAWAAQQGRAVVGWEHYDRRNPVTALWDLAPARSDGCVADWLAAVDAHNAHPRRLLRVFVDALAMQPAEAVGSAMALLGAQAETLVTSLVRRRAGGSGRP